MEKNAFWPVQLDSYNPEAEVTSIIKLDKEVGNLIMCYLDDVVIATATLEDHIKRLDA